MVGIDEGSPQPIAARELATPNRRVLGEPLLGAVDDLEDRHGHEARGEEPPISPFDGDSRRRRQASGRGQPDTSDLTAHRGREAQG